jgi:hypothetical protein
MNLLSVISFITLIACFLSCPTEVEFLDFEPFVLAVTTIFCALEEIVPVQADQLKILILEYIPLDTVRVIKLF